MCTLLLVAWATKLLNVEVLKKTILSLEFLVEKEQAPCTTRQCLPHSGFDINMVSSTDSLVQLKVNGIFGLFSLL